MLVMPILNINKNGISKIYNVEVKLKKALKVKESVIINGLEESDIILNGSSFNNSVYNTKGISPNVITNFLRGTNYKANKKDFLITTREYNDSKLYDLYNIPEPPRKIASGLDNLYGSALLDIKKQIPGNKKGRYISLKQLGVDKHITEEKLQKLQYYINQEKDNDKRKDILQLNGVSDLEKTIDFMRLFECTIIGEATLTEDQINNMINILSYTYTRDYKNLSRLYEIAKENQEVYSKLTKISKIINGKPLNLIQSKSKSKVLVKTSEISKSA